MIEINDYLWGTIYVLKTVYDHDPDANVMKSYKEIVMDGDYIYEVSEEAIRQFFADTREYYDDEKELSVYVFFDPIMTEFWELCEAYEERLGIKPEENRHRGDMERALNSALYIPDYSIAERVYMDAKRKNGCRIVLLCYCDFCSFHWIPEALSEAYDAFVYHTRLLREAMAQSEGTKIIELTDAMSERREAA